MPMYPQSLVLLHFVTVTVRDSLNVFWRESQKGQGYRGFFVKWIMSVEDYNDIMILISDVTSMPRTNMETDDEADSSGDITTDSDDDVTE